MADSRLEFKLSERLKEQFEEACDDNETSMSVELRKMIANFVRSNKRHNGKSDEDHPVTDSKSVNRVGKKTT